MDEVYGNNRFYIEIDQKKEAVFTEVSGLSVDIQTEEYPEGGNNGFVHKIIGRTKIGNIILKQGVTKSQELLKWVMDVSLGKIERKNISIVMYNLKGKYVQRWNFIDAAPIKWTGAQFQASGNAGAVETFEFIHRGMQLGDPPPDDAKASASLGASLGASAGVSIGPDGISADASLNAGASLDAAAASAGVDIDASAAVDANVSLDASASVDGGVSVDADANASVDASADASASASVDANASVDVDI